MIGAVSPFACALPTVFTSVRPDQCFEERLLTETEHKALQTVCLFGKTQTRELLTVIIKCFLAIFAKGFFLTLRKATFLIGGYTVCFFEICFY